LLYAVSRRIRRRCHGFQGISDKLSGLPNLKVISCTSAFRYKQREIEPQKVAKELGVEARVAFRFLKRQDLLV